MQAVYWDWSETLVCHGQCDPAAWFILATIIYLDLGREHTNLMQANEWTNCEFLSVACTRTHWKDYRRQSPSMFFSSTQLNSSRKSQEPRRSKKVSTNLCVCAHYFQWTSCHWQLCTAVKKLWALCKQSNAVPETTAVDTEWPTSMATLNAGGCLKKSTLSF